MGSGPAGMVQFRCCAPCRRLRAYDHHTIRAATDVERRADIYSGVDRMLAIAELAHTADDFRAFGETMDLICERVRLLTEADFVTVYLASPEDSDFNMWGSSAIKAEYLDWAQGRHQAPKRTWAPVALSSESGQPRMITDVFQRPDLHMLWGGARIQGYRGLGVMPMVARGHVLGTVNTYWREPHEHSEEEIAVLQIAARLAGVAVETSTIAERHRAATAESMRLAGQLEVANQELIDLSQAQVELAEALAQSRGDPAEAVCQVLFARFGTSAMLCNPDGKARAFAGRIAERADMAAALTLRDIRKLPREASFSAAGFSIHRVGNDQGLGFLLLGAEVDALKHAQAVVLRHALALLAFELESERTDRSVRGIARPGMLHALARGRLTPYMAGEAAPMLQMSGQPCRLAFVAVADDVAGLAAARRLNRLPTNSDFLAAAAEEGGFMVLLEDRGVEPVRRTIARLLEGSGLESARVGVSGLLAEPVDVPAALEQARSASRVGLRSGVTLYEDLGFTGELLSQVGGVGATAFVARMMGPILESDRRRGTTLVASLDAYLRHRGSLRHAAAELGVHANTLQLRLTRVARLTGLDLHDPRQLGLVSVALDWNSLLATD